MYARVPTFRPDCSRHGGGRLRSSARRIVCRASYEGLDGAATRRAALLGTLSVPMLMPAFPAYSARITVTDSRRTGAKEAMESADQARDSDEDQRKRFAFQTTAKLTDVDHKARAKESYNRLDTDIKQLLDKKLYNRVVNETRHQLGTLRYDLQMINQEGDKPARKAAQAQYKQAIKALEDLDLYARLGKGSEADQAYSDVLQKLGSIVKAM